MHVGEMGGCVSVCGCVCVCVCVCVYVCVLGGGEYVARGLTSQIQFNGFAVLPKLMQA